MKVATLSLLCAILFSLGSIAHAGGGEYNPPAPALPPDLAGYQANCQSPSLFDIYQLTRIYYYRVNRPSLAPKAASAGYVNSVLKRQSASSYRISYDEDAERCGFHTSCVIGHRISFVASETPCRVSAQPIVTSYDGDM